METRKEILKLISRRLDKGAHKYGHKDIDVHDGRDWITESMEEVLDLAVYVSAKLLQHQDNERKFHRRQDNRRLSSRRLSIGERRKKNEQMDDRI